VNRKRLLVDVAGYAATIPFFVLYNHLERSCNGYVSVIITVAAYLPIAVVWHFYYVKYSEQV
jgi:hypothetical protein